MKGMLARVPNYPLIELEINGRKYGCLIDTGFSGDIAMGLELARELGLDLSPETAYSRVAGESNPTKNSYVWITWFDRTREVGATVFLSDTVGPVDAVIGVHLLIGYILVVDFNEGEVVIKDPSLREALP